MSSLTAARQKRRRCVLRAKWWKIARIKCRRILADQHALAMRCGFGSSRTGDKCKRTENNGPEVENFYDCSTDLLRIHLFHQRFTRLQCPGTTHSIRILNFYARYPHFVVLKTVWTAKRMNEMRSQIDGMPSLPSRWLWQNFAHQTGLSLYGCERRGRVRWSRQIGSIASRINSAHSHDTWNDHTLSHARNDKFHRYYSEIEYPFDVRHSGFLTRQRVWGLSCVNVCF